MSRGKALTITYLVKTTLASLNGSDKEADNISSIKKITKGAEQYPYGSAQWVRRALRDQLGVLGWNLSEGVAATIAKGASTTRQNLTIILMMIYLALWALKKAVIMKKVSF